jgi:pimeloyl-ACP methyl ester carboxylesterase
VTIGQIEESARPNAVATEHLPVQLSSFIGRHLTWLTFGVPVGVAPVLIGHSMGCWVVLNYLAMQGAPAGVLMAPGTPQGLRRLAFRVMRRHPCIAPRTNTFGNQADLFSTPAIVRACAARIEPESTRAVRETAGRLPDTRHVTAPMLALGAETDGLRIDGDVSAVAGIYQADVEFFPDMGHVMMLEATTSKCRLHQCQRFLIRVGLHSDRADLECEPQALPPSY